MYQLLKKFQHNFTRFDTIHEHVRQTDGQTLHDGYASVAQQQGCATQGLKSKFVAR